MIDLKDKKKCCGCSACVQKCPKQCISMKRDEEGFDYPFIDKEKCINCNLCESVCPCLNSNSSRKPIHIYAAFNPDNNIRKKSSSGGIFSLLAQRIISNNGVVFGAKFNNQWEVVHDYTESLEGIDTFRKAKYVQSDINRCYIQVEKFLKEGRQVLFSGTPCQIIGLKFFLRKDYYNLITVDTICHSVPSPGIWKQYLNELCIKNNDILNNIKSIDFRDKKTGWNNYSFHIDAEKWHLHSIGYKNYYMKLFLNNVINRPSCSKCPAKPFKGLSDITLGDFWGIETIFPEMNDNLGVSLVLVNTNIGYQLLQDLKLRLEPTTLTKIIDLNPSLTKSTISSDKRLLFYNNSSYSIKKRTEIIFNITWLSKVKDSINQILNR